MTLERWMSALNVPTELAELVDRQFRERASWEELIKSIRGAAGVDIFSAQKIALSHPAWRRVCNDRINNDPKCRKQAASHIRHHGLESLIASDGKAFWVIEPQGRS